MNRLLFLTHRYLGIGLGLLMVMWCLSGIVMMYVPFPTLEQEARLNGLQPLRSTTCCLLEGALFPADDAAVRSFEIETLGGQAILTATNNGGRTYMLDISAGTAFLGTSPDDATEIAGQFARGRNLAEAPGLIREIESDQWTTGRFRIDRPLYHFDLNDVAGTEIYVSSTSGRVLQLTTSSVRFWNWLGSVPHWIYFTQLREDPLTWTRIVVWTSLIGCLLTIFGIYIGIRQIRRRNSDGRLASPYRGLWYWHHIPGLIFGVFTLTWVFSGLLSMTPWGLFANSDPSPALSRLNGETQSWGALRDAIPALVAGAPADSVHIQYAPFDGDIFAMATSRDGAQTRLAANGDPSPLSQTDYARTAILIGEDNDAVSWEITNTEDAYYYGRANAPPPFPVLRVTTQGEDAAHYYISPESGRLLRFADGEARWHRWLFNGLHSLDFTQAFRWRPFWDVLMIVLLLGATAVCATGSWLGAKRVLGLSRGQGFLVGPKRRTPARKSAQLP